MEFLEKLVTVNYHYALAHFQQGGPYGIPSILCTLLFAWGIFAWRRRQRGRRADLRLFVRALLPRKIVMHRSSFVDLRLWILNVVVLGVAYTSLAISGLTVRNGVISGFTQVFGEHEPTAWPLWLVMAITTLAALLSYELAYWFGHYLFHRFEFLWEFHKVHHSAEVMTTLTELRQHPVEILAFVNLIGLFTGATLGALTYVFGPGAHSFTLLNANIALMLFLMSWGHLRHSHIWLSFQGLAGRLFQSPAHHQIHHSTNPAHFNKNLGFALAIWDWAFGTLYIPSREPEAITFGVGETHGDYDTVMRTFVRPFGHAAEHLAPHSAPGQVNAPRA
jgi:sterol desaturase/sphingolipid hydroxylase (fatty acid hydroxylase superfamily)